MSQMQQPLYEQLAERYAVVPAHWLVDGGYVNLAAISPRSTLAARK